MLWEKDVQMPHPNGLGTVAREVAVTQMSGKTEDDTRTVPLVLDPMAAGYSRY